MSFDEVLAPFLDVPGAVCAAFLDPQGEAIASAGDASWLETIGAFHSVWLGELSRIAGRSGLGALRELALDFEERRVLAAEVKDGYFLLLVFDAAGLVARARARLGEARGRLAAEIG